MRGMRKRQRTWACVREYRLRAEEALGHPLPPKAVVHHATGSLAPGAPLVICQDESYHRLLHRRMRVAAAGGDPNLDRLCTNCGPLPAAEFYPATRTTDGYMKFYGHCKRCSHRASNATHAWKTAAHAQIKETARVSGLIRRALDDNAMAERVRRRSRRRPVR
jgi:hypothetical protein